MSPRKMQDIGTNAELLLAVARNQRRKYELTPIASDVDPLARRNAAVNSTLGRILAHFKHAPPTSCEIPEVPVTVLPSIGG